MKCHLILWKERWRSHSITPKKNPPSFWSGLLFCAESALLKSLDLVATSWDEKPSGEPAIYTTAPFLSIQKLLYERCPRPFLFRNNASFASILSLAVEVAHGQGFHYPALTGFLRYCVGKIVIETPQIPKTFTLTWGFFLFLFFFYFTCAKNE